MKDLLFQSRQEHHRISLEYSQMKDINDKLAELLAYGVMQNDIIYWTHIFKENKLDILVLGNDLREYGNVKVACNNISSKLQSLRLEADALTKKIEDLKKVGVESRL